MKDKELIEQFWRLLKYLKIGYLRQDMLPMIAEVDLTTDFAYYKRLDTLEQQVDLILEKMNLHYEAPHQVRGKLVSKGGPENDKH